MDPMLQSQEHPSHAIFKELGIAIHGDDATFGEGLEPLGRAVYEHMQRYDGSHDWLHIERVLRLAVRIYRREVLEDPQRPHSLALVVFAALTHDIADKKYASSNDMPSDQALVSLLTRHNVAAVDPRIVAEVVENVSYSHETKNPEKVREVLERHPELGIVQDADRLDAIGAVGIGRTFMYGGAKATPRGMEDTLDHFEEKLLKLEHLMKTKTGKQIALERTAKLRTFMDWWREETSPRAYD